MNALVGMLVFCCGGLAGATFLLPARGVKGWAYETWWFVYVLAGLVVCPPVICLTIISASPNPLPAVICWAICWSYMLVYRRV